MSGDLTSPVAEWNLPPEAVAWGVARELSPEERASILAGGPLPDDMKPVMWDVVGGRHVYEIKH